MLRSNKHTTREEIPKPNEDSHLVFETFDVKKNQRFKSNKSFHENKMPITDQSQKRTEKLDRSKKSFLSPMHQFKK